MNPIRRSLMALVMAAAGVSAQTPPQTTASSNEPWPPAGVHLPNEPGITLPALVSKVQPQYTSGAMRAKLQGFVVVACVIGVDGAVSRTRIVQSLDPVYGLDDAALQAAKQWRFTPAMKDGGPVPIAATLEMAFTLRDVPPPSTWPTALGPSGTAGAPSNLTPSSVTSDALRIDFGYPTGWVERNTSATALSMVVSTTPGAIRAVGMSPPRRVPADLQLPLPIPRLQSFADGIRRTSTARQRALMGVGQVDLGGRWWVWLDVLADPSSFPLTLMQPDGSPILNVRMWPFTTSVEGYELTVMCFVASLSAVSDEALADELRRAGPDFKSILGSITIRRISSLHPGR